MDIFGGAGGDVILPTTYYLREKEQSPRKTSSKASAKMKAMYVLICEDKPILFSVV